MVALTKLRWQIKNVDHVDQLWEYYIYLSCIQMFYSSLVGDKNRKFWCDPKKVFTALTFVFNKKQWDLTFVL